MQRAVDEDAVLRLEADVRAALKRKPAHEPELAGALRVLARHSPRLRGSLADALETTVRRRSFERPLFGALARALCELGDDRAAQSLARALRSEEAGGLAGLSAAALTRNAALTDPLAKLAANRHPHLALAAEVARVARRESNGAHASAVAPKIKEAHRIALCQEVFVPLLWEPPLDAGIAPALTVLRDAERHLGRWLVLAEVAVRSGDRAPLEQARHHVRHGAAGARAAWALVAWALDRDAGEPSVRANVELVSRLSDRPSANRDTTFLFRLAQAKTESARQMLEGLTRGALPASEQGVRAALHLARDYGVERCREQLVDVARHPRRERLQGLAAAALFDLGARVEALDALGEDDSRRKLPSLAWATMVRVCAAGQTQGPLVTEPTFRRLQLGWVE
ncbi:MAG TPA: hypothetical protein VFZ53_13275 [Polyangiaceae bacterium]